MKKIVFLFVCLCWLSFVPTPLFGQNEEAVAQAAEQVGRLREALTHYVAALQQTTDGGTDDQRLREKIITIAQRLKPAPVVPEEAERHLARGRAAVKSAQSPADFQDAIAEFRAALLAAPWVPEAYYNLGVVQDKGGQYAEAIRSLKLYLLSAPDASDAKQVRDLIFEVEYRRDKAEKDALTKQRQEQEKQESLEKLSGLWTLGRGAREYIANFGCTSPPASGDLYRIEIRGHQIKINLLQLDYTNCRYSWRYPDNPLNLVVFEGTFEEGHITGTANCYDVTQAALQRHGSATYPSDFYVERTLPLQATISWNSGDSSFTMSPSFPIHWGGCNTKPQTFDRE